MVYPDIKDAGALVEFVRWGNRHHGLLDGTTLADGGDGVSHPALPGYQQSLELWITPAFSIHVPGLPAVALPPAVPGMEWHDYATFSGTRLAFYRTNIVPIPQARYWVASFGVGDTWRVSIASGASVIPAEGGGTLALGLTLTRFGQMQVPEDETLSISLTSNTLGAGQPLFTGGVDDFLASDLILQLMDISPSGNKVLLAAMPSGGSHIARYGAPRGLYLLEFTRSAATLSLVKSRAEMMVAVSKTGTTTTCSNVIGGFFDAAGDLQVCALGVVTVRSSVTTYDPPYTPPYADGSYSIDMSHVNAVSDAVTITGPGGALATATASNTLTLSGTATLNQPPDIDWLSENGRVINHASSSMSGRAASGSQSDYFSPEYTSTPTLRGGITPSGAYPHYDTLADGDGAWTKRPLEFTDESGQFPLMQIGLGIFGHRNPHSREFSILAARHAAGGYVAAAVGGLDAQAIVSVHPATGEVASKRGAWSLGGEPSFGWV